MTDASLVAQFRHFLDALERKDAAAVRGLLHDDVRQVEYPNQLVVAGAERDAAALVAGLQQGAKVITGERYEIVDHIAAGDKLACRVKWRATLQVPVLGKAAGDELRADFGVFVTLREGRILEQHNYDCFWTSSAS